MMTKLQEEQKLFGTNCTFDLFCFTIFFKLILQQPQGRTQNIIPGMVYIPGLLTMISKVFSPL